MPFATVAVLGRGRLIETGTVTEIFDTTRHEATLALLGEAAI